MSMTYDCCPASLDEGRRSPTQSFARTIATGVRGLASGLRLSLRTYLDHRERRDAFCALLDLDDRRLRDIGVSRADVEWGVKLPLSVDAAAELRNIALRRGV